MLASPPVHKIFFFLSFLFGMEGNMVSKESELHIDRTSGTGRITYREVRVPQKEGEDPAKFLQRLDKEKAFGKNGKGIELKMTMFRSKEGKLMVEVFFAYEDEARMCRTLGLERKSDGAIRFEPAQGEELISTNGDSTKEGVSWKKDDRLLRLELKGRPLDEEEREEMSVLRYVRE